MPLCGHPSYREGLIICKAMVVPTFLSYYFLDPEYCSGPGNRTRELPLCNKALYSTKEALIGSEELFYRCVYFN